MTASSLSSVRLSTVSCRRPAASRLAAMHSSIAATKARFRTGSATLADFPHTDGTWPDSRAVAHRLCAGAAMNAAECHAFLRGNAIDCYGLERFGIAQ